MSKVVDERVVEMRFDNKQFESNVQTSLSTLEKLKQKLNLSGASKGLEKLNDSANKVNMGKLSNSIGTVSAKFSALEVMGVTALANITNSAVNAGKRMVSALTIDPIKTGFQEYETQINSVQTILANTQHAGTTLDQVTSALDELNKYADKTIYNFTEMTRNIGTFTAAGVDLNTSVTAIQGIANLAAVSGSTSQQASTAMYQLSQALSAGTVKLMDWNSVVNAGMGGKVFQDALMETARVHGIAIDDMIDKHGSFRETLSEGWITSEILTETLEKFTMSTEGLTDAEIEANREKLRGIGYTEEQIDGIFKLGNTATDAATKVKTFTQLWDVMKESAQSGWAKTWQIIIGDFTEAKTLWTSIANVTTGFINKMSDSRNNVLENVFGGGAEKWPKLIKMVDEAGVSSEKFKEKLIEVGKKHNVITDEMVSTEEKFNASLENGWVTRKRVIEALNNMHDGNKDVTESTEELNNKLKKFQNIVDDVWNGDYKNGQERVEALTKAGYDYAEVQELVNKTVDGQKLKLEDLSNAQLKSVGYTDEQIEAINKLKAEAENADSSLSKLIDSMSRQSGRTLLIESFKNFGKEFKKFIDAGKEAWTNVFGDVDASSILYNLIDRLHDLSEAFSISKNSAENFKYICEGVFSIFQLGTSIISMSVVGGLKILAAVLEVCGTNLLELGGNIGKAIISFRDWVKENTLLIGTWDKLGAIIGAIVNGVKNCVNAFLGLEKVQEIIKKVKNAVIDFFAQFKIGLNGGFIDGIINKIESFFTNLEESIKSLPTSEAFQAGIDVVTGLANGIKSGAGQVINAIISVGKSLIDAICGVLGIHSPSTVMIAIGAFIILGLIKGILSGQHELFYALKSMFGTVLNTVIEFLQNGFPYAISVIKGFVKNIFDTIKSGNIDWSALFVVGTIGLFLAMMHKLLKILEGLVNPLKSLKTVFDTLTEGIRDLVKAKKLEFYSVAIRNLAISVAILAGAVYILAQLDWKEQLLPAVIAIAAIAAVLALLVLAINKMNLTEWKGIVTVSSLALFLLALGGSMLMIVNAVEQLARLPLLGIKKCVGMLIAIGVFLSAIMLISKFALKDAEKTNILSLTAMILGISVSLLIISKAIKSIGTMGDDEIQRAINCIFALSAFMAILTLVSKRAGWNAKSAGGMILRMAVSIGLLVMVIKLIAGIPISDAIYGLSVIGVISLMFAGLTKVSKFAGANAGLAGSMFLKMALAVGLLVLSIKMISSISIGDIAKGLITIGLIELLFIGYVKVVEKVEPDMNKAGNMFLKMGLAIGALALAIRLIAGIPVGDIIKGYVTIAAIMLLFSGIVRVSEYAGKHAEKAGKMIFKMSVAVLILVGAIAILSLLKPEDIAVSTAAISSILGMFALIVKASQYAKGSYKSLILMAVCIGILGGVLITLSCLDSTGVRTATLAIDSMLGMFAVLLAASKYAKKVSPSIIALMIVVSALAAVLYLISGLNPDASIKNVMAMSVLLLAMTGALTILSFVGAKALVGSVALLLLVGIIYLLAQVLNVMNELNVTPSMETAKALSVLLLGMSAACVILGVVGVIGIAAVAGALALIEVVTVLGVFMSAIGFLVQKVPKLETFLDSGIPVIEKIGHAIGSFFGNIIGGFAGGLSSGLPDFADDLSSFMDKLQPFIDGASSIDASVAKNITALGTAITVLTGANFFEKITSNFMGKSSLGDFAEKLIPFGKAIVKYSNIVKNVDADAISDSATAAKAISDVARSLPNTGGLLSAIVGDNTLSSFAMQLIPFGIAMKLYSKAVEGINPGAILNSATAAKALSEVANSLPNSGGLASIFTGDNTLSSFAMQLIPFGIAMKLYSKAVEGINPGAILNSATAAKALSEVANSLPNSGGLVSIATGDNTLSSFAMQLIPFGIAMKLYSKAVEGINVPAITLSALAAKAMSNVAANLPNSGGLVSFVTGDNTLTSFAMQLVPFGLAMKLYSKAVEGINVDAISMSVTASEAIMSISEAIPNSGGLASIFTGDNTLSSFAMQLIPFGIAMKLYSKAVEGINVPAITLSVTAAKSISRLADSVPKDGKGQNDLKEFGKTACSFAEKLSDYSDKASDIDSTAISNSVSAARKVMNLINDMSGINTSGVGNFKTAVSSLASTNMAGLVSSFSGASSQLSKVGSNMISSLASGLKANRSKVSGAAKSITTSLVKTFNSAAKSFVKPGVQMISNLVKGIKSKASSAKSAAKSTATGAASGARGGYSGFYNAGSYLVSGFAKGIRNSAYLAASAARYAAQAAKNAIDKSLRINSPAKELIPSGMAVVEGLAKGIYKSLNFVRDAGKTVANYTRDVISDSISKMSTVFTMDIDAEPTIRPIVDLSNVEAGANKIGKLMNIGSSVTALSKVGTINSMMNKRNQNGANDDVVSAIDKLGNKLDNVGNTYNSIDGVSYNDGTDVSDAIKTIIRAATRERRV